MENIKKETLEIITQDNTYLDLARIVLGMEELAELKEKFINNGDVVGEYEATKQIEQASAKFTEITELIFASITQTQFSGYEFETVVYTVVQEIIEKSNGSALIA